MNSQAQSACAETIDPVSPASGTTRPGAADLRAARYDAQANRRGRYRALIHADRPGGARPWHLYAALVGATAVALSGFDLPWLVPATGFWLLVGLPVHLFFAKLDWPGADVPERLIYALLATLALVLGVGLGLTCVLPLVGVDHPLGRVPVALAAASANALLLLGWRPQRWRMRSTAAPSLPRTDRTVLIGSALAVLLAVIGANRLNNGASGAGSLVGLGVIGAVFALLFAWRGRLRPGTMCAAIYLVALALLLMTSLRGWFITGHDIQREFGVFQLTATAERWDIAAFRDPYNACLSITVLPTMLVKLTGLADQYVYKALFQLLVAAVPVCVYLLARRFGSTGLAILATLYFVAFPTFFSDLPFLNRQGIAFLFLGGILLLITSPSVAPLHRAVWFVLFSIGMVVSHYSSTYVFVGVLVLAWIGLTGFRLARRILPARMRWLADTGSSAGRSLVPTNAISLRLVAVVVLCLLGWTGPATHTGGQLELTARTTFGQLIGGDGTRSADVSYSLFSRDEKTPQRRLDEYAAESVESSADERSDGAYPSLRTIQAYPTVAVTEPMLPLTRLGSALDRAGIDVVAVNQVLRSWAARLIQLLMALGIVAVMLGFRRRLAANPQLTLLSVGSVAFVASQVVLPGVSADYGVLRAMQQALFCVAPFLALGSVLVMRWAGRWAGAGAAVLGGIFFASLTGLLPQALGGYPPQLQLNNAGQYYDVYYVHAAEVSGQTWLRERLCSSDEARAEVQSEVVSDRLTFGCTDPGRSTYVLAAPINDIYPTYLRQGTYVFLGDANVRRHEATVPVDGDLVTYRYPQPLLDSTRDLIYANGSVAIYR